MDPKRFSGPCAQKKIQKGAQMPNFLTGVLKTYPKKEPAAIIDVCETCQGFGHVAIGKDKAVIVCKECDGRGRDPRMCAIL